MERLFEMATFIVEKFYQFISVEKLLQTIQIGVPEVTLAVLFGVVVFKGNIFTNGFKGLPKIIAKTIASVVLTLTIITIREHYIHNLVLKTIASTIAYIITFKFIWKFNLQQMLTAGNLTIFLLLILEVMTYPFARYLVKGDNYLLLFLPARVMQILIIAALIKFKIDLSTNHFFTRKWRELTFQGKISIVVLNVMIFMGTLLNTNYITLYFELQAKNVSPMLINSNLFLFLAQTILFILIVLVSLTRTIDLEKFKEIVSKKPVELFEEILSKSNQEEIYQYSRLVIRALHINSIVELERFMDYLKSCLEKFDYRIDEEIALVEQDYTNMINFVEFITTIEFIKDKLIYTDISKDDKHILCTIEIKNVDEIEMRKIQKELNHNKHYNSLKNELLSQKSILNASYQNDATFNIKVPFTKHYSEV